MREKWYGSASMKSRTQIINRIFAFAENNTLFAAMSPLSGCLALFQRNTAGQLLIADKGMDSEWRLTESEDFCSRLVNARLVAIKRPSDAFSAFTLYRGDEIDIQTKEGKTHTWRIEEDCLVPTVSQEGHHYARGKVTYLDEEGKEQVERTIRWDNVMDRRSAWS